MFDFKVGLDSPVGIATHYGQEGVGIAPRQGRDFPHSSRPALGHNQIFVKWLLNPFPGGETPGKWRRPPTPFSGEVKERVELYPYSTHAFVACNRARFNFTFTLRLIFKTTLNRSRCRYYCKAGCSCTCVLTNTATQSTVYLLIQRHGPLCTYQ